MKNLMLGVFFMALAIPLLLLEAAEGIALIFMQLWERWRHTAQVLQNPPPGGMYVTMVRRLREKKQPPQKEE